MANVQGLLLIVACYFIAAEALVCYECKGGPDSDCAKGVVSSMKQVYCPEVISQCMHTDLTHFGERTFSRGCTKYGGKDLCTLLYELMIQSPETLRVNSCETCWAQRCNTGVTEEKKSK